MAVFDAGWRAVWWPWLLAWAATAVLLVATVVIVIVHRRRDVAATARRHQISFYLDENSVMDLYRQYGGKYKAALRQEVQERISSSREIELTADLAPLQAGGKRGVNSEVFRTYIEKAEPITVVTIIVDVLEHAGDIVHVNLPKREVTAGEALDKALHADLERPTAGVRLRDLEAFVSIQGRFRATHRTDTATTFDAPYGDPDDPTDGPQVRLICAASGLRGAEVPAGPFRARCLGRVEDWNPDSGRLIVHPIAIFR